MMELVVRHDLKLEDNMEALEAQIKQDIDLKYNLVVTEDSLPETKKLMAEINKQKDEFKKTYKAFKDAVLAPLMPLDAKAKQIEAYYDDARKALDNQVKNFEKGKLEAIKVIVEQYRDDACLTANITPESITITDLVILSAVNVNSKGYSIAKKTSDTIDQRIQAVELQIAKAKLEAEEKAKRDREISEKARQEAEERAKQREAELIARNERERIEALQRAEREKAEAVERARQEMKQTSAENAQVQKQEVLPKKAEDGKVVYQIAFTFEIKTNPNAPIDKVIEAVKNMMLNDTGKENLKKIEVV